jgi:hypothetical protein
MKVSYIDLIVMVVIGAGSISLMYEETTAQDIHADTSDWKTWTWNATCGDFHIKYSPRWDVHLNDSGELGCNGTIVHLPAEYESLNKASEGVMIRFNYSRTSAVSETTIQNIENSIVKFPEKSFFPFSLRCIKTNNIKKDFTFIECYKKRNKELYVISVDIKNDSKNIYENQVKKLLKSFKLNN